MPQTHPTGIYGVARANLRDLIASSALFQATCGVFDATAAKDFIYFSFAILAEASLPDFFVVIGNREGANTQTAIGTGGTVELRGVVTFVFFMLDAPGTLLENEITRVLQTTDGILSQMNANRETYFDYTSLDVEDPMNPNEDDRSSGKTLIERVCQAHWGPSPG